MPRFRVLVSQLRTLDLVVDAADSHDADARVRARLRNASDAEPWLDSATVIQSVPAADPLSTDSTSLAHPTRQLLTADEAGEYLGISRTKVFELMGSGALESIMIGRLRRISIDQLQRFIESRT